MSNPRGCAGRASTGKSTAPTPGAKMPQVATLSVLFPRTGLREIRHTYRKATKADFGWPLEKSGTTSKVMGPFFSRMGQDIKLGWAVREASATHERG